MNKPALFVRIAAVLTLVHAVLHTIGGVIGDVPPGPAAIAVQAMKANQFSFMGQIRSFWDFNRGLGLGITIFLTAEAVVFWQLGSLAKRDARALRPILCTFALAYVALAVNSYIYFFLGPVVVELLIAACLAWANVTAQNNSPAFAQTQQD